MKFVRSIIVAILLLAAAATPAFAAGKAKMTADSVVYNYDLKKVVANGHVVLEYDDIKLTADYIEIDLNENSLLARGTVQLHDKQRDASGDVLIYDLDTRVGAFQGMRGQFTDASITGKVFIRSEGATVADNEYMLKGAWLTTCDLETPHYHLEADEIEIYLGQQIVLHHVRYYEGRYRLFSLPYLVIPLGEETGVGLQAPQIGYTPETGLSIQLAYGYVINDRQSGMIHLDMQKSGMGFGVDHKVRIGENFTGTLSAYELMNNSTTHIDWRLNAGAEQKIGKLKLNLSGTMNHQYGVSDFVDGEYSLYQAKGSISGTTNAGPVNLSVDFRHSDLSTENYLLANGNTSLKWDGGYTLSANGSFRYRTAYSYTYPDHSLVLKTDRFADYSIRAGKAWDWGTFSTVFEERMDLENPDAAVGVTRMPELKLVVPKLAIPVLGPFDLNIGFGRFTAPPNSTTVVPGTTVEPLLANRGNVEIGRQALSLTAGGFNLTFGGRVRGSYYETNQYLLSEVATLTWNQKYAPWLRTSAAFSWTALQGDTPFEFDRQTPGGSVTGGLFIEHKVVQASVTSGYDFLTERFRTVSGRLRLNVGEGDYLQLAGSYNPNEPDISNAFGYVLFEGNVTGKAGHLKANMQFNPRELTFDHADLDASLTLFEKLILEGQISFTQSFQYDAATLSIGYDWHCRLVKASYNFATNAIKFQLIFKAFPTKSIGFGG